MGWIKFVYIVCGWIVSGVIGAPSDREIVHIDLERGFIRGYSSYITLLTPPRPSRSSDCDVRSVVRLDLSGPFSVAKLTLTYKDKPRLWTLDVSDSKTAHGFGSQSNDSKMAELQILNRQMRIYGNGLPGYQKATLDGGYLLKVEDDFVKNGMRTVTLRLGDRRVEWTKDGYNNSMESMYLFRLRPKSDIDTPTHYFNRWGKSPKNEKKKKKPKVKAQEKPTITQDGAEASWTETVEKGWSNSLGTWTPRAPERKTTPRAPQPVINNWLGHQSSRVRPTGPKDPQPWVDTREENNWPVRSGVRTFSGPTRQKDSDVEIQTGGGTASRPPVLGSAGLTEPPWDEPEDVWSLPEGGEIRPHGIWSVQPDGWTLKQEGLTNALLDAQWTNSQDDESEEYTEDSTRRTRSIRDRGVRSSNQDRGVRSNQRGGGGVRSRNGMRKFRGTRRSRGFDRTETRFTSRGPQRKSLRSGAIRSSDFERGTIASKKRPRNSGPRKKKGGVRSNSRGGVRSKKRGRNRDVQSDGRWKTVERNEPGQALPLVVRYHPKSSDYTPEPLPEYTVQTTAPPGGQEENDPDEEKMGYLYIGLNRVIEDDFRHGSGLCEAKITLYKDAENECETGTHTCHRDAVCTNTRRSFKCACQKGFYGTGKICEDVNECDYNNGNCVHQCTNGRGNYTCSCKLGFSTAPDKHDCIDNDECLDHNGGCEERCVNTLGGYHCACAGDRQLSSDGKRCSGGSWCKERLGCSHHCENDITGTRCACRAGYRLHHDGKTCIDTCFHGNGGCHHLCIDTPNGPLCSCAVNYSLRNDSKTCSPTCGINNGGCRKKCEDTNHGPLCSCAEGWRLDKDGRTCLDVDECAVDNGGCNHQCINARGDYHCVCPPGLKVGDDRKTCFDVNECELSLCDHGCVNTKGSHYCTCRHGYQLYAQTHCADVNECLVRNGGCHHDCENLDGSFLCSCREDYKLHPNGKDCIPMSECPPLLKSALTTLDHQFDGDNKHCTVSCVGGAVPLARRTQLELECGASTGYQWRSEGDMDITEFRCSANVTSPSFSQSARFTFPVERCRQQRYLLRFHSFLTKVLTKERRFRCNKARCQISRLGFVCDKIRRHKQKSSYDVKIKKQRQTRRRNDVTKRRRTVRRARREDSEGRRGDLRRGRDEIIRRARVEEEDVQEKEGLMRVHFDISLRPGPVTRKCNVDCIRKRTRRKLKRTITKLRRVVNRGDLQVRYDHSTYVASSHSFRQEELRALCPPGAVLVHDNCVSCAAGTRHTESGCQLCVPGWYQELEGQTECQRCPDGAYSLPGAVRRDDCGLSDMCKPGHFSTSGLAPCEPCPVGTYQPEPGRLRCIPCGNGTMTRKPGARDFSQCMTLIECAPGQYYSRPEGQCSPCPQGEYQPWSNRDHCLVCPGNTTTDGEASDSIEQCKSHVCGGHQGQFMGYIESPNFPAEYPAHVECTWVIQPVKRRRLLVVVPEIFLAGDRCADRLVMRKSSSPYSVVSYEACGSSDRPVAFTARSRRLWINFKSDSNTTSKGFRISYVTYNEEYQDLIESIVRDGRLYSYHQHQQIFKDREILNALLEVIATPYNYFKYSNMTRTMFPKSFIRLLAPKVRHFFSE